MRLNITKSSCCYGLNEAVAISRQWPWRVGWRRPRRRRELPDQPVDPLAAMGLISFHLGGFRKKFNGIYGIVKRLDQRSLGVSHKSFMFGIFANPLN
jgi:hypothetical protein